MPQSAQHQMRLLAVVGAPLEHRFCFHQRDGAAIVEVGSELVSE
jgi:hypothetical protein